MQDPGPHQSEKLNPDPHLSQNTGALEDHNGAVEGGVKAQNGAL